MGFSADESRSIVAMLAKTPIFASLDAKHLQKLVDSAKDRDYKAGDGIVREGDAGVGFFLIIRGSAEVRHAGKTLSSLGPGQYFGEMTLLDEKPRSADVVATSDTRCLVLSTMNFAALIVSNPKIALELLRELARRLRATNKSLSE
ncbi:MAG: cyclic nucleotide-binding domain-containing protein [Thaumarchaeota archaeon]|nr:cyclic nucleotide-binding domain-containing protein [Nitrososphaerota archaeon]